MQELALQYDALKRRLDEAFQEKGSLTDPFVLYISQMLDLIVVQMQRGLNGAEIGAESFYSHTGRKTKTA